MPKYQRQKCVWRLLVSMFFSTVRSLQEVPCSHQRISLLWLDMSMTHLTLYDLKATLDQVHVLRRCHVCPSLLECQVEPNPNYEKTKNEVLGDYCFGSFETGMIETFLPNWKRKSTQTDLNALKSLLWSTPEKPKKGFDHYPLT